MFSVTVCTETRFLNKCLMCQISYLTQRWTDWNLAVKGHRDITFWPQLKKKLILTKFQHVFRVWTDMDGLTRLVDEGKIWFPPSFFFGLVFNDVNVSWSNNIKSSEVNQSYFINWVEPLDRLSASLSGYLSPLTGVRHTWASLRHFMSYRNRWPHDITVTSNQWRSRLR